MFADHVRLTRPGAGPSLIEFQPPSPSQSLVVARRPASASRVLVTSTRAAAAAARRRLVSHGSSHESHSTVTVPFLRLSQQPGGASPAAGRRLRLA